MKLGWNVYVKCHTFLWIEKWKPNGIWRSIIESIEICMNDITFHVNYTFFTTGCIHAIEKKQQCLGIVELPTYNQLFEGSWPTPLSKTPPILFRPSSHDSL